VWFKTNISICNMPNDYKQDGKSLEQQVLRLWTGVVIEDTSKFIIDSGVPGEQLRTDMMIRHVNSSSLLNYM